jgi:site-specific DNA-methyltransferase (adenine-specific)
VSVWEFEKLMFNKLLKMNRITNVEDIGSSPNSTKPPVVGSTVILGDCVEVMKGFSDNQFDLAIVDPEYGIGRAGQTETFTKNPKHKRKYFEDKKWDSKPPGPEYWEQLFRVSKNQIVWGANYFTDYLPPSMGWIFWDKGQDLSMSDGELAYTSFQRALRRVKINRGQLMVEGGTIHPTQKPVKLYKWILKNYATEGMNILDTHLGSGSNRIACDNMGFDFTGIEIDKGYFDLSEKRFKQYKSQLRIEGW